MAKDPVCGMDVDEKDAEFMTHVEHETYYFCTKACQDRFELNGGIRKEGEDKNWWRRAIDNILKEPKEKPPKCH